jgi:hypothetical protein
MSKTRHRIARGPEIMWMDLGQSIPTNRGFDLKLVYVEDSIPVFRTKPKGHRAEAWTASEDHPGVFYRCCRWPGKRKPINFDKLINRAMSTRGLMDAARKLVLSGQYSFEEGRA